MMPWVWAMQDADEAERRGDATAALDVMRRRFHDQHGEVFWHPSRLRRLHQLESLGGAVPAWAVSRWVLAQARQAFDERDPLVRERIRAAVRVTSRLCGWDDDPQSQLRMLQTDWCFRQVYLWEEYALARFVSHGATPDLLAGAEQIAAWVEAPMSGYVYVGSRDGRATWTDLATGDEVVTADIGSGALLAPEVPAIGRLVPDGTGLMFESAPQEVPLEVARQVALAPGRWLDILEEAACFRDGALTPVVEAFDLFTDVPEVQWSMWLADWRQDRLAAFAKDGALLVRAILDRAASELASGTHRFFPPDPHYDDAEQAGWQPWACLAAALVDPVALRELPAVVAASDVAVLEQLRSRVAEPARTVIDDVVRLHRGAA